VEEIRNLYLEVQPLGVFQGNITGGEPTLHPQLFEILEALDARRNMFAITTNGLRLDRKFVLELKQAGLAYLAVSVNSLNAVENDDQRGTPGHLEHAIEVMNWAREADLPVGFSTVLSHQSIPEFERMAHYAHEHGFQLCPAFAVSQGRWTGKDEVRLRPEDYAALKRISARYPSVRSELTTNFCGKDTCPGIREKIFVTVFGEVTSCQLNPVSFGNVRQEPVTTILERMRRLKHFTTVNPICVVSSDKDYVERYIVPTAERDMLPVPIHDHPMRIDFPDLPDSKSLAGKDRLRTRPET
jgi:MoaA/NifB/PqqE/SkfB family radical SAM enzyme